MKKIINVMIPFLAFSICGVACAKNSIAKTPQIKNEYKAVSDVNIDVSSFKEGHNKEALNDGDFSTYWEASELNNATVYLDLKNAYALKNVTQVFNEEDIWYFKIEASLDGSNYFALLDNTFGVFGKTFSQATNGRVYARYIRMFIIKSEKGKFPSSKEFYVEAEPLNSGINLALGAKVSATDATGKIVEANNLPASNIVDGDHGSYWCRNNDFSFPIDVTIKWDKLVFVNSVELTEQDTANYEFEIIGYTNKELTTTSTIAPKEEERIGSFFKFDLEEEKGFYGITYRIYRDAIGEDGSTYWASLAEMKVIGHEDVTNKLGQHYCYIDHIESNSDDLEISDDNLTYRRINNNEVHGIVLNIHGLKEGDKVHGYSLANVLNYNFGGKTNSYLDEKHHISYATRPKRYQDDDPNNYYSGEKEGETCQLTFDLGNPCLLSSFYQKFHEEAKHHFYIEVSFDGKTYLKCYEANDGEIKREYDCNLDMPYYARYVRLTIIPTANNIRATSDSFYIYGLGSSMREDWWQNTSGVIRFYPKLQPTTLKEITDRLDEFRYSGYRVIELHQPYEGVADIWAGLGGTDNYQIDPIIGNFSDLKELLDKAHQKGMKVFMFGNVGYGKYNSDVFLKAARDYGMGINSKESKFFRFSKTIPIKEKTTNDPHYDPNRWFYSDVAGAYYYEYWQRNGDIPTYNFENEEWQKECANYINFWANIGIDGIALDAPSVYDFGFLYEGEKEGETYEQKCSRITFNCITRTLRKNNLFSLPEGNGETKYIGDYKYRAVQNYTMTSWGSGAQSLGITAAREKLGETNIEKWVKNVHDEAVGLGGVAANGMNFEDIYDDATPTERKLEAALTTTTGHLAFLHLGSDAKIGQDIMKSWPTDTQLAIARSFALQNSLSSLNPSGERKAIATNDNSKYYAFYRANMNSNDKAIVVFNYQDEDIDISVDISSCSFNKYNNAILYDAYNDEKVGTITNSNNIRVFCKAHSHRVIIAR